MRLWTIPVLLVVTVFAATDVHAGREAGDLNVAGVNKDCVDRVFGLGANSTAPMRGQERFDHFKKRMVTEPGLMDRPFRKFVAIGGKSTLDGDPPALPQCGATARGP